MMFTKQPLKTEALQDKLDAAVEAGLVFRVRTWVGSGGDEDAEFVVFAAPDAYERFKRACPGTDQQAFIRHVVSKAGNKEKENNQ
jgi:hypothetical protein